jgi:hypothetical protein
MSSSQDAIEEAQRRLAELTALVDNRKAASAAKPWAGNLLDVVQKYAELTIDNGTNHETVRFRAWGNFNSPLNQRKIFQMPDIFFVDAGSGWNAIPVAKIKVYYSKDDAGKDDPGGKRSYGFSINDGVLGGVCRRGDRGRVARRLGVDSPDHPAVTAYLRQAVYAAHLCFLALTGTDLATSEYTNLFGKKCQPSDRYTIQKVNHCVRCARKLTAPSSIDAAFGPECQKIVFGSTETYNTRILGGKR